MNMFNFRKKKHKKKMKKKKRKGQQERLPPSAPSSSHGLGVTDAIISQRKKTRSLGVRIRCGRIFDPKNGKTCHQKAVESITDDQDSKAKIVSQEAQRNTNRYFVRRTRSELKKKEEDADLHLAHKIMQNRQYIVSVQADDEHDFDEIPNRKCNKKMEVVADDKRNLSKGILIQQEHCQFCFENSSQPKHLVISIANFTHMALPQWQPVVEGHCCILPLQGLISSSAETRQQAAQGLGELIDVTSEQTLKEFVVPVTG